MPKRCKKCREFQKKRREIDVSKTYNEIIKNWSVEARKERQDYFYYIQEVTDIAQGDRYFVIGRKGSGKTAIAQHLAEISEPNVFSIRLSFKNFPFNILYSLENNREYTAPNQYISMWKYLIYSYLCRKMIENQNINLDIRNKLTKLYGDSTEVSLNKLIEKWTSKSFGLEVLGVGFNYERERAIEEITWIDTIEILERVILEYCDDSRYYFLFDELDEDYKEFTTEVEARNYMCMLTSLLKAVQQIRSTLDVAQKCVYPIVFLRSDIYSQLKDADKNKWRESLIDLEWNTSKIKSMLAHRICVAMSIPATDFESAWYLLFSRAKVKMGNNQRREMDIFSYIERSTEMRPRDFVQYIKECVELAKERQEFPIIPDTVKEADDNFSEYLKGETIDELFPILPEIDEILGLLSTIRKQSFGSGVFEKEYNALVNREAIPKRDIRYVLLSLFDAGVIGNQPSMKGQSIFRFSKKSPRFNFNETMIIHRGLYKALQIF
jgi:energy-coupling factor transporter ATP-binding protein EcfA2